MNKPAFQNSDFQASNLSFGVKAITATLNQLDSAELFWLSGYCTALADQKTLAEESATGTLELVKTEAQLAPLNAAILFASQTGNAQIVATDLYQSLHDAGLAEQGIRPALISLQDFNLKKLKDYQLILIVTSTHGEGDPPDDGIDFHEFIGGKRAPKLEGIQHAVLGLGDSSYEFFCQTAKDFDQALSKQGSQELLKRVDCDLDFETQANDWITQLVTKLSELGEKRQQQQPNSLSQNFSNPELLNQSMASPYTKNNPFTATVLTNQRITGRDSIKHINHIELSLENSNISYKPGDSLGIWARNNKKVITEILCLTGLTGKEEVQYKREIQTLEKTLLENLELSLINKTLVADLASLTQSSAIKLIVDKTYPEFIQRHQVVDLFKLAPIKLQPQQLVDLLKPMKPRMYSIASSIQANPEEVHLTVALVETEANMTKRFGTASYFLIESLEEDDEVLIFVEQNKRFKLASDEKPIIMVGPGTGIAPFRSFLQQRETSQASGENWLFFGNPNFNSDFLYQTELQAYIKQGILNKIDLAFSRDQQQKIYVQDRLLENAPAIWQWLSEKQASIYVCGDMSKMAKDVHLALVTIISEQGAMTDVQAEEFLKSLKKENRYQRDVY